MEEYRRWEDNIKMNLEDMGVDVMSWLELTRVRDRQRALRNPELNFRLVMYWKSNCLIQMQ